MTSARYELTEDELLALAGLLRLLISQDGRVAPSEWSAMNAVADRIAVMEPRAMGSSPYRSGAPPAQPVDAARWTELMEEAERTLPAREDSLLALSSLDRPEAHEAIYVLAHGVAVAESINREQGEVLELLRELWSLEVRRS